MRIAVTFLACILLVSPTVIADPGNGRGHDQNGNRSDSRGHGNQTAEQGDAARDEANQRCAKHRENRRDDGPPRGPRSPQGNGTADRSIHLNNTGGRNPTLTWTPRGLEDACGYMVYRSSPTEGEQLVAVVDSSTTTYSDTSATTGSMEYYIQAIDRQGTKSVHSNSEFINFVGGCSLVSVSPFGRPPILVHEECL